MSRIVVFGASGNVGRPLVSQLVDEPEATLRLVSSSPASADALRRDFPGVEVVVADLADGAQIRAVIEGAERLFVMYPDFVLDEEASTRAMIDAVRDTGSVEQVVRLLGVVPEVQERDIPVAFRSNPAMPCWVHWRGRELWRESNLPVTFVNPWAWYMQSLLWLVGRGVSERDVLCLPDSHTLPYIDTRDIADVTARVLLAPPEQYLSRELGLTGHHQDCFSFEELAQEMSIYLGRQITYSDDRALFAELHGEGAEPLGRYIGWERSMVQEYRKHTDLVYTITGNTPRRLKDWIIENRVNLAPVNGMQG